MYGANQMPALIAGLVDPVTVFAAQEIVAMDGFNEKPALAARFGPKPRGLNPATSRDHIVRDFWKGGAVANLAVCSPIKPEITNASARTY